MLLFKERFKQAILDGAKTVTRRGMARRFKVGGVHQAYTRPPWSKGEPFARLKVIAVTTSTLRAVLEDETELKREGFDSDADFVAYVDSRRGSDMMTPVTRIEFEVVQDDPHCLECDGNGYHTDDCPMRCSTCGELKGDGHSIENCPEGS